MNQGFESPEMTHQNTKGLVQEHFLYFKISNKFNILCWKLLDIFRLTPMIESMLISHMHRNFNSSESSSQAFPHPSLSWLCLYLTSNVSCTHFKDIVSNVIIKNKYCKLQPYSSTAAQTLFMAVFYCEWFCASLFQHGLKLLTPKLFKILADLSKCTTILQLEKKKPQEQRVYVTVSLGGWSVWPVLPEQAAPSSPWWIWTRPSA